MTTNLDTEAVVKRIVRALGGKKETTRNVNAAFDRVNQIWNQDALLIGRILRAHLFVEYFMTEYLQTKNPNLGNLSDSRLTFAQKVSLLGTSDPSIAYLIPGIKHLNKVRNRLAHSLKVEVTIKDRNLFLSIAMYGAFRKEQARHSTSKNDPISVLEGFSNFAGGQLAATSDPMSKIWSAAIRAEFKKSAPNKSFQRTRGTRAPRG